MFNLSKELTPSTNSAFQLMDQDKVENCKIQLSKEFQKYARMIFLLQIVASFVINFVLVYLTKEMIEEVSN
jgi:hypothetical protein